LILVSRRGNHRDNENSVPCPIDIPSLTAHYNAIAAFKSKLQEGTTGNLPSDPAFKKNEKAWRDYQTKWCARSKRMRESTRIAPLNVDADVVALNPQLLTSKSDRCGSLSCKLLPEKDSAGTSIPFVELYDKRCTDYNSSNLTKISADQLGNYLLLVRMEIMYLASCDVEWADDTSSASTAAPQSIAAEGRAGASAGAAESTLSIITLSSLPTSESSAAIAGVIASHEDLLLNYALRLSQRHPSLLSNHGEVLNASPHSCRGCRPRAPSQLRRYNRFLQYPGVGLQAWRFSPYTRSPATDAICLCF